MKTKCPFCQSDNLIPFQESKEEYSTLCCEDCGCSFQIIQEPQDILLKNALDSREEEKENPQEKTGVLDLSFSEKTLEDSDIVDFEVRDKIKKEDE